jgi:peptidoglycan L-alanyl-D-glutamate endopeptidase CwlK
MATAAERLRIARQILNWEARRDSQGRLSIYPLPHGDGGGKYEVAGINEKYHPNEAKRLKAFIEQGRYLEAEALAIAYIADYTDGVAAWTEVTGVEAFLRDTSFNRGPTGAARIFQMALGVPVDGMVGRFTLEVARTAESRPVILIEKLRQAREQYEREWVRRSESSPFWQGLVNRWNKARDFSLSLVQSEATPEGMHGSQRLFSGDVRFLQRFLKSSGFTPGPIDGIWGSKTNGAQEQFLEKSQEIARDCGVFDQRSEQNIFTLFPKAQKEARNFLKRLKNAGINARIISGTRTYAVQNILFAQGRTLAGTIVTNARGGESNHNFGIAWDIGIFTAQGQYLPDSPLYDKAAEVGLSPNLEWGGHWQSFKDKPHYQMKTGLTSQKLRERFEKGETLI